MSSRMSKYYDEPEVTRDVKTRFRKNEELYKEINKSELNSYDIKSNATVLCENKNEIDVEKIKKILDTKYGEIPKRKSIRLDIEEDIKEEKEITKEYDINVILEKAREGKEENYEEERLKKIRDTQFDILKNLNLEANRDLKDLEPEDKSEEDLKTLINTIAFNESKSKEENSNSDLDILSELKGSGNTEVLSGLKEEIEKEETKANELQMINSFYTSSNMIKNKDFEDIEDNEDFAKDVEANNTFLKILIAIVILVFIAGIIIIIKTFVA